MACLKLVSKFEFHFEELQLYFIIYYTLVPLTVREMEKPLGPGYTVGYFSFMLVSKT